MKKILFLCSSILILSCSKDNDTCDQQVTGTEVEKTEIIGAYPPGNNNHAYTYKYYITLDHGNRTETNEATVSYYTGRGTVCFEGYK